MDDTQERLLNAAGQLFAERGYEAATVRDISAKAGANIAAINYHFGDKHGLYVAAVQHAHNCCDGEPGEIPPDLPAEQQLRGFIAGMVGAMMDRSGPDWAMELLMREMARPTDACVALVRSYIEPKFQRLLAIIKPLLPADLPAPARHQAAFSIVAQCLLYRFHAPVGRLLVGDAEYFGYQTEDVAERIFAFSLAGLAAISRQEARR